jgi:RecA/RadA recombinase
MGGPFQEPQALNRYLRKLQRIADEHGVAVVITNQAPAEGRRWVLARWKKRLGG